MKINEENINQIVEKYQNGISGCKLSKEYSCSTDTIYEILKKNNIKIRSNKENSRKYNCNHNYFENIDTEDKAYWLGFIYADGYITSKRTSDSQKFGITLSIQDRKHLEKLNQCLNSNYPIREYTQIAGYKPGNKYCRLLITSQKLVNDLKRHGVIENKTNILEPPNITEELVPHFIRGYMDGDGCITSYLNNGYLRYCVKLLGTEKMLDYFNDFLKKNFQYKIPKYYKRKKDQQVMSLEIASNIRSKNFLDLIYKNATIYLDRKYDKYLKLCEFMNSRT